MKLDSSRSLLIRLFTLAVLVLVTPMTLISLRAMGEFELGMNPEMDKKAAAIGRDVAAQVDRAVGYGIPVHKLVGVEEFFDPVLAANPEIRYLAITDKLGRVLFLRGAHKAVLEPHYQAADLDMDSVEGTKSSIDNYLDLALPVAPKGSLIGHVHVGFDQNYVATKLHEILYDVLVVMAVSLIIAFEILLFVVFFNVTGPLKLVGGVVERARRGDLSHVPGGASDDEVGRFVRAVAASIRIVDDRYRQLMAYIHEVKAAHFHKGVVEKVGEIEARINFLFRFSSTGKPEVLLERRATDIRLPLFLFVFAEELSRSFLPLYVRDIGQSFYSLSPEMIMALPMAVFMACIALASPYGGRLIERLGARRVFLLGMIPALLGYVMTGAAVGVTDLVLWRGLTGLGYALVTMACQSYIFGATKDGSRAQGLGVFVGAVLTASICGTAMGGVLAERVGFRATFFVSAVLVLLAGILISRMLASPETPAVAAAPRRGTLRLLSNWRFSVLMLFAAMPSKMALTGFLFFLVPVILSQGDWGVADMGRMMVLYPLVMVVVSPLAAWLADRMGWRAGLVALGGLIGGAGLLAPMVMPGQLALVIAIVALGVSHGLSASPQLAMIPNLCWTECRNMGQTNVLAFVRLMERVGSTLGPLLAAAFIPVWGLNGAVVALGAVVLVMAVVFAAASLAYGSGPHIEAEEDLA
ncbi:MAG: MFS transporter [Rhodospirillaceae bacterium]|nr:MFS transporter [Rhodospirillales bacterium]